MKKYLEPVIQILFLTVSVIAVLLPQESYLSLEGWESLYLTNIINAVIVAAYLALRFFLRKKSRLESFQRGMLLFVIYSCLPVFVLIDNSAVKILTAVCFFAAALDFILKNSSVMKTTGPVNTGTGARLVFSLLLLLFGSGFLLRGGAVVYQYTAGTASLTDMLVSISDIVISVIWITVGTGFIRKKPIGTANILPCYIQASLLFAGLIFFLLVNPLITGSVIDYEAVVVIVAMGLFFFVPTVLLLRQVGGRHSSAYY